MRKTLATLSFLALTASAHADPLGFSWDSNGPCNAETIFGGTPCVLNQAARDTAIVNGSPLEVLDLEDRALQSGLNFAGEFAEFQLLGEITQDSNINEFGWYDWRTATSGVIFGASQTMGAIAQIVLPQTFAFYYRNTAPGSTEYFDELSPRQFATFNDGQGRNFVGVEDIQSAFVTPTWSFGASDYDHNDVLVSFKTSSVPEPSTALLMGIGLIAFARKLRRQS